MIVYFDTSAMVKLYVEEAERERVVQISREAGGIAISELGLLESHSALRRKASQEKIPARRLKKTLLDLERDWSSYCCVHFQATVIQEAKKVIQRHLLRSYDAIHLASALVLAKEVGSRIGFLCFDRTLKMAAMRYRSLSVL